MKKKIEKLFRIYFWPFIITVLAVEVGIGVFGYYFYPPKILKQETLLQVEAIVIVIATFTGIIIPLQIARNQKKEDDRRVLAFSLGLIWTELRKNRFVLEQIKVNYLFARLFVLSNFDDLINILLGKYRFVHKSTTELHDKSFVASQNSGAITTFDNDDAFNDVTQAYENLTNFRLASLLTLETLKMKKHLIKYSPEPITVSEESMFVEEIKHCLKNGYKELLFCQKVVDKAIASVDTRLNKMAIISKEEIRGLEDIAEVP